ncbi:ParM/StbA family protein [Fictibacillus nanhaiensis]|uniref:ParM/StbA family protein n=1 Tax=Fictibacillus nanhaiensis TaxID=742169 RepID=UPI002E245638|nr:ParM/StbA family protein [Fictibacillus nanhaiensis]
MILGVDAGNSSIKICSQFGLLKFPSAIGEARELNLKQQHGEDDIYFEHNGRKGFAGTLALYESEFCGSIMGDSKAHSDTLLRVLIGIHKYLTKYRLNYNRFKLVLGQPISKHTQEEKEFIKTMVKGSHTISVNGVEKTFYILDCQIAAEGASSYYSSLSHEGLVRILDIGSATINYATILDNKFIDKDSGTLSFGCNTNKSNDLYQMARGIVSNVSKKWSREDTVLIVGGISETACSYLSAYFPNANQLLPIHNNEYADSIYANAVAFYNIGVSIYE